MFLGSALKRHVELDKKISWIDDTPRDADNLIDQRLPQIVETPSSDTGDKTFIINIGGFHHEIRASTLRRQPDTLLGIVGASYDDPAELVDLCDRYTPLTHECYFDRAPSVGASIIDFHRSGHLHFGPEAATCAERFFEELRYWRIEVSQLHQCCLRRLHDQAPDVIARNRGLATLSPRLAMGRASCASIDVTSSSSEVQFPPDICCSKARHKIYKFLDDPTSSMGALVFMGFSMGFIILTIITLVLGSMRDFQYYNNQTQSFEALPELERTDMVCVLWFTFEWLARLIIVPQRWAYVKSTMSIIDLLAISPFYFELALNSAGLQNQNMQNFSRTLIIIRVLRVLRILRVLRVLKMARYSSGMQTMGRTLKKSSRELSMMVFFMLITNLICSTAMYFIESDEKDTKFISIPAAAWWAVVTMTTVGYGDIVPTTVMGRMIASVVSLVGITLLAYPISVVVQNFEEESRREPEKAAVVTPSVVAKMSRASISAIAGRKTSGKPGDADNYSWKSERNSSNA